MHIIFNLFRTMPAFLPMVIKLVCVELEIYSLADCRHCTLWE